MQDNAESNRGIRPGVLAAIGVVVVVLAGTIVILRRDSGQREPRIAEGPAPAETVAPSPAVAPVPARPQPLHSNAPPPRSPGPTPGSVTAAIPSPQATLPVATTAPTAGATNWEQRIDGILGSDQ